MDVRKVYEKYPYPAADATLLTDRRWVLAPMDWIGALWKPADKMLTPKKILVAGCGTGREAFALQRHFLRAKIVAVDFSPRSIAIARRVQKSAGAMRNIRFVVADLAHRNLGLTADPRVNMDGSPSDGLSDGCIFVPVADRRCCAGCRTHGPDGSEN